MAVRRRRTEPVLHTDSMPRLVDELVASKVDVIVTFGYRAALVAKQATTLPVVSFGAAILPWFVW
jgi:putative tryptophan/tyrosine transport system substrate-binding protein